MGNDFWSLPLVNGKSSIKKFVKVLRSFASMALMATMIGVSNVIMEEDRSINDTRARIEQQVIQSDEEE